MAMSDNTFNLPSFVECRTMKGAHWASIFCAVAPGWYGASSQKAISMAGVLFDSLVIDSIEGKFKKQFKTEIWQIENLSLRSW